MLIAALAAFSSLALTQQECGQVVSVEHGPVRTIIEIDVNRVRAEPCIMQIPISYLPKSGKRTGPRALVECPLDGLGCLRVAPYDSTLEIVVGTPRYDRPVEYAENWPRYDDDPLAVPFYSVPVEMQQNTQMPNCYTGSDFTGYKPRNQQGASPGSNQYRFKTYTISLVPHNAPFNISGFQPEYSMVLVPTDVTPRVAPALIANAQVDFFQPNYTTPVFYPTNAGPNFKNNVSWPLIQVNMAANELFENRLAAGLLGINETLFYTTPVLNMSQPFPAFSTLTDFTSDRVVVYNFGTGCLSLSDWNLILGRNASEANATTAAGSWKWNHCGGSDNCTGSVWGCGYWDAQIRRDVKFPLIAETPNCRQFHLGEKLTETATLTAIVRALRGATNTVSQSFFTEIEVTPVDATYARTSGTGSALVTVTLISTTASVPKLLSDPVDQLEGLNCFTYRDELANATAGEVDTINPFRVRDPDNQCANCTFSILPNQRGYLLLPTELYSLFVRSECGGMNYGPGFWMHIGNLYKQFVYNVTNRQVLPKENAPRRQNFNVNQIISTMGFRGTSGCLPGSDCRTSSPCTLLNDELGWLRTRNLVRTNYVENFGTRAINISSDIVYRPGTVEESPNGMLNITTFKWINLTNYPGNIRQPASSAYSGCDRRSNLPYSIANRLWNFLRPNMWFASNRAPANTTNKLYIEDTFQNPLQAISEGVRVRARVEIAAGLYNLQDQNVQNLSGCINAPLRNNVTDELDFCNDLNASLTGVAGAEKFASSGTLDRDIVITVTCGSALGGVFCLNFDPAKSFVVDKTTGQSVDPAITVRNQVPPQEIPVTFPDIESDGTIPPINTIPGADITSIEFRWRQKELRRSYFWQAAMLNFNPRGAGGQFREFTITISIDEVPVLIAAPLQISCKEPLFRLQADALSNDPKCFVPPSTLPVPVPVAPLKREPCGFWDFACHNARGTMLSCGGMWVIWLIIILVLVIIVIVYAVKYEREKKEYEAKNMNALAKGGQYVSTSQATRAQNNLYTSRFSSGKLAGGKHSARYLRYDSADDFLQDNLISDDEPARHSPTRLVAPLYFDTDSDI